MAENYVIWLENLRMSDVERVGGKNASLGEMISQLAEKGVRVPGGFATTAEAYRAFLAHDGLHERISAALAALNVDDVTELARVGAQIRQWILDTPFPEQLNAEVEAAWADDAVFRDGHWRFDEAGDDWRTLHYVSGGQFYAIGRGLDLGER